MTRLTVKDLTLAYDGKRVVNNLSFSVENGEYLCIVGENGTGKSTLLKGILGIIKPVSGSINFCCRRHRTSIGYLPQQQAVQHDFPASVKEVVMSGFAGKTRLPWFSKAMKQKALNNLNMLGIKELISQPFSELSGGQQQRVLLARALCATEDLLLLDEPVNALDPNAAKEMYSVIKGLNESGMTVIMISHDINLAVKSADKILHLSKTDYFFGTSAEYMMSGFGDSFLKGGAE